MSTILHWGLMLALVAAPLPFGTNRPWSWSLLALFIALLLALWASSAIRQPSRVRMGWRQHGWASALFCLALLWTGVQTAGWTPASLHHPLWHDAARAGHTPEGLNRT